MESRPGAAAPTVPRRRSPVSAPIDHAGPRGSGAGTATLGRLVLGMATALAPGAPFLAEEPAPIATGYSETVTVTATRLTDRSAPASDVPASVTVITREEIAASGARTIQEFLMGLTGAILFDETGNAVQMQFDLRGLTGNGVTVLLDGARVNDPRNNHVALETIGLGSIERIEITRGAAAATVGGGSAAGVVSIVTRTGRRSAAATSLAGGGGGGTAGSGAEPRSGAGGGAGGGRGAGAGEGPEPGARPSGGAGSGGGAATASDLVTPRAEGPSFSGSATGSYGMFATAHAGIEVSGSSGSAGFDWFLNAARDRSDGFRQNAGGGLTRIGASAGYTFPAGSRLSLSVHSADDDLGQPGSLTLAEYEANPDSAAFNSLDSSDLSYRQATVNWRGALGGPFSLAGNLSYLAQRSEALTTGRAAAAGFGGFILDGTIHSLNGAAQATAELHGTRVDQTIVFGLEAGRGTNGADACGTSPGDLAACDPASFLNSSNSTARTDAALFAQESLHLGKELTLMIGGRWDRTDDAYRETTPDPENDQDRTFSETSWKAGLAWNPDPAAGLYLNYGESFQPPTVEDLFAFPGFGSNPSLDPVLAKNYEIGARGFVAGAPSVGAPTSGAPSAGPGAAGFAASFEYLVSLFRMNLSNEIVFTPRPTPQDPFAGQNENVGRSYREGIETTLTWRPARWAALTAGLAWTRARFVCTPGDPPGSARCAGGGGSTGGNEVPLVPDHRYGLTALFTLPAGFAVQAQLVDVGEQVLVNDEANQAPRLPGYTVVNLRAAWQRRLSGPQAAPPLSIAIFAEAHNLLDEQYATRGIDAFDPATFASAVFVTPAPPRTLVAGASFLF